MDIIVVVKFDARGGALAAITLVDNLASSLLQLHSIGIVLVIFQLSRISKELQKRDRNTGERGSRFQQIKACCTLMRMLHPGTCRCHHHCRAVPQL
jgi:hypothetical protein